MLTPMQKDVLIELFNIHVGALANLLSTMVNQKIILSIPEIEIIPGSELDLFGFEQTGVFESGKVVLSNLKFEGEFKGSAFILFPSQKAKLLVNACMGEDVSDEDLKEQDLSYDEIDVIKEICNITLNSVIGEFGNLIDVEIEFMAPEVECTVASSKAEKNISEQNDYIVVLLTSFFIEQISVQVVILISLNFSSVKMIMDKVDELLEAQND